MPKNDEGEFELILGNRQLISVFLIVVVLLGVFFSMGYIVGRNSAGTAELARTEKPAPAPAPSESTATTDSSSPEPAAQPPSAGADATLAETTPPAITQPEKPVPERAPKAAAKETKPKPDARREAAPESAPASVTSQVSAGVYWQVVATARPDAEIIAEALGKKGFHAILSPSPKEGVFRVLVGPLRDAPTQAQTRTNLEAAGFKNPILRKY